VFFRADFYSNESKALLQSTLLSSELVCLAFHVLVVQKRKKELPYSDQFKLCYGGYVDVSFQNSKYRFAVLLEL
jgi:hypothetical protein